jgi:flagellar basal body-associated protein FliL
VSKEITLIMIIIVLFIVVCGLTVAVVKLIAMVKRSTEQLENTNDFLLTRYLINERDQESLRD